MSQLFNGDLQGHGLQIGIVVSRWNTQITGELLAGAERALAVCGVLPENIRVAEVPGAFEIPIACRSLILQGVNAVVALGCVVKGDTAHFEYVSDAAMQGIREVSLTTGIPITCGILTTYDMDQALLRAARDENNKGSEAAFAAVEIANLLLSLQVAT